MGATLDSLRDEFASETKRNIFGFKKMPKGDAMLYLGARMRDAENEKRQLEKRIVATENAAIDIIGRYDSDGGLVQEFKRLIEQRVSHL